MLNRRVQFPDLNYPAQDKNIDVSIRFRSIVHFKRQFAWLTLAAAIFTAACGSPEPVAVDFTRVATVAGQGRTLGEPFGIAVRDGAAYISDGTADGVVRIAPDGTISTFASGLSTPSGIAFTPDGSLIVADTGSHTIKQIDAAGAVTLVAGADNTPGDADGAAADARFAGPIGVAVTTDGRIYVADTYNDAIRVIENGTVRTFAGGLRGFADGHGASAKFELPVGLAVWQGDKVLVADAGNRRIRVVEPDGRVWTLAGNGTRDGEDGFLSQASFETPTAVTVDAHGIIYIADGNAIRAIGRRAFAYVETLSHRRRGLADGLPHHARFNRPSGVAVNDAGELLIADSDNGLIRALTNNNEAAMLSPADARAHHFTAEEFRALAPGRWPYDPPERTREIAGTLGEIRGEIVDQTSEAWFHNGLDIPGSFGETARFLRDETVLDPAAAQNFNTARELIRMPTMGYVHIRIGRETAERFYPDARFQFNADPGVPPVMRVPRGARFAAGEAMGTLNSQNHVHLIAGRPGFEMNALDALVLPGISDGIPPVIESVQLLDEYWNAIETQNAAGRIIINQKARVVVTAYDRKDGNTDRRRLAPYQIGMDVTPAGSKPPAAITWNISFELMPLREAVKFVYAPGSRSGATGGTIFNFIASNRVDGELMKEGFIDPAALSAGVYTVRVGAADFFGNVTVKEILIEVNK